MPRKRKIINIGLLMKYLKPWMKEALKLLAAINEPVTTGEILEKLIENDIEVTHSQLLHWLKRLEKYGLIKRYKIGYYRKYAWQLTEEIKNQIKQ